MKKLFTLTVLITVFTFASCDKDEKEEIESERFTKEMYTADNFETIKDNETKLEWVNDTRGCFAGIVTPNMQCADTDFADFSDWRTPTADEMSTLIKEIASKNMKLNYINTSCAIMSTSEEVWVFTENSSTPGQKTTQKPGNAGLRCVREFK